MFLVGAISWWYGDGWRRQIGLLRERVARTLDFFSIGLLTRTLFSPFRQISVGAVDGPLGVKIRAFFDKLLSRLIGAGLRLTMIFAGLIVFMIQMIFGGVMLIGWMIVPLFPLAGVVAWSLGWMPVWNL